MSTYAHIIGGDAKFAGIDQGIDFLGAGPVYAQDNGVVTRHVPRGSGWPGLGAVLVYKLTAGPAAKKNIYVSEDFKAAPGIGVGSVVTKGQVIGYATGSNQAPGIETGWATDSGLPLAPRPPARPAPQWTAEGQSFLDFVTGKTTSTPKGGGSSVLDTAGNVASSVAAAADPVASIVSGVIDGKSKSILDPFSGVTKWITAEAGYAATYAMLVLFAIVLGLLGVLALLGIHPRTAIAGGARAAAAAA